MQTQTDFFAALTVHVDPSLIRPAPAAIPTKAWLPPELRPVVSGTPWKDVTNLARPIGFRSAVAVVNWLAELPDEILYDALWLAFYTMSLDRRDHAAYNIEVAGASIRLAAVTVQDTVFISRPEDF